MSLGSACRLSREIAGVARLEALVSRELVSCGVTGGCLPGRRGVGCSGLMGRQRIQRGTTNNISLAPGAGNMARRLVAGWGFRRIVAHRRRGGVMVRGRDWWGVGEGEGGEGNIGLYINQTGSMKTMQRAERTDRGVVPQSSS